MNGTIDVFTLLALIAAIVVILKLRSVVGRHTDEDDARIERRAREREFQEQAASNSDNVITLPRRDVEDEEHEQRPRLTAEELDEHIREVAGSDERIMTGLKEIAAADPDFDPEQFVTGAKDAYELIVTAFAEGNLRVLKDLLGDEVYSSFAEAINEREKDNVLLDQTFVGINKTNVLEAGVDRGDAQIVVKFVSELISVTRDKTGEIKAGDPNLIDQVTDIWTFSRDVSSPAALANPNWKLVATEAPN